MFDLGCCHVSQLMYNREHIFRKHDLAHQCGRCWQRFKTKNLLTDHSRATTACAVKTEAESPDDVTPQQVEQLKRRKRDGSSHVERWNDMYKTLFQPMDGDDIPSPCEFGTTLSGCCHPANTSQGTNFR